jgi:hypothetical protein
MLKKPKRVSETASWKIDSEADYKEGWAHGKLKEILKLAEALESRPRSSHL